MISIPDPVICRDLVKELGLPTHTVWKGSNMRPAITNKPVDRLYSILVHVFEPFLIPIKELVDEFTVWL